MWFLEKAAIERLSRFEKDPQISKWTITFAITIILGILVPSSLFVQDPPAAISKPPFLRIWTPIMKEKNELRTLTSSQIQ